ncbi:MAG TPA: MFS transporter [Hyphomicrobium sp.]|nr:MFS transporter [Hyphomicrobium sp.]
MTAHLPSDPPFQISRIRFVGCVFLPYAAGYFLSSVFRTIDAAIGADVLAELHLRVADLGVLTTVYFIALAIAQILLAALTDRGEPSFVQSALMLVASFGALIFAEAQTFTWLLVGRALIGLGVAATLTVALKTFVAWMPSERVPFVAGMMVMFGGLGALAAAGPASAIARSIGWRALFVVLAALMALAALAVLLTVPETTPRTSRQRKVPSMAAVFRDRRFSGIAPISALGIGTSWSLQSLWATPCMRDVQGFDQTSTDHCLSIMAFAVCVGAPTFGLLSVLLRRVGIKIEHLLIGILSLSAMAQIALVLRLSLPPALIWTMISLASATTVLSYALIGEYFPESLAQTANGALNLINVVGTLVLQSATGLIFAQWSNANGSYPLAAYQAGFSIPLALQLVALVWFLARRKRPLPSMQDVVTRPLRGTYLRQGWSFNAPPHIFISPKQNRRPFDLTEGWPFAALASTVLCSMLTIAVVSIRQASPASERTWISHAGRATEAEISSVTSPKIVGKTTATAIIGIGW